MFVRRILHTDLKSCKILFKRGLSNSSWDLMTGVCVERLPTVTPPLNEIQKQYKEMLSIIELEKSLKADHELRHETDKIQAELLKNESADMDPDTVSKITAQDFEDAANEEYAKFKFADIVTEADRNGDKATLDRCLQRHLVLVTNHKLGSDEKHILPQGLWKEGETLRQTAERIVSEHCGPDMKVQFLSNAPCGFYKYKYPSEINGKVGAKVFFYYANHKSGAADASSKAKWLTRTELKAALPPRYNQSVQEFLIEERF